MSRLDKALEANREELEEALREAEEELAGLDRRRRHLQTLIGRARAALGVTPPNEAANETRVDRPLTLHEAMQAVLQENNNEWIEVKELAREINRRGLYRKRDGSPVEANQIHARANNYRSWFEKNGPRVRLR